MTEKTEERQEVILDKPHTHYGKEYQKGEKIKVTESEKRWLVQQKIVKG